MYIWRFTDNNYYYFVHNKSKLVRQHWKSAGQGFQYLTEQPGVYTSVYTSALKQLVKEVKVFTEGNGVSSYQSRVCKYCIYL